MLQKVKCIHIIFSCSSKRKYDDKHGFWNSFDIDEWKPDQESINKLDQVSHQFIKISTCNMNIPEKKARES